MHSQWWDDSPSRSFDIFLIAYEEQGLSVGSDSWIDKSFLVEGPKIGGYYRWLSEHQDLIAGYERVALFDDDILTTISDLDRLFAYCEILSAEIAAPALSPQSFYTVPITRRHCSFLHRWTNWVEIMAPIFSVATLKKCLDSFALNLEGGSWIEHLWTLKCEQIPGSLAIIDHIPIFHTRPVQSAGSGVQGRASKRLQYLEGKLLFLQTGISAHIDNICGLTVDGHFLHI